MSKESYQQNRARVFEIYGNQCGVCGSSNNLTTHHIVRKSEGGGDEMSNLYPLCREDHDYIERLIDSKEPPKQKVIYHKKHKKHKKHKRR